MQQVSADWIAANNEQFLPLNDAKIYYYVEDQSMKASISNVAFSLSSYWDTTNSNIADLTTKSLNYNKYITLDNNFVLDGDSMPIDTITTEKGAIGKASKSTNISSNTFGININFSSTITETLENFTIVWSRCFGTSPYRVIVNFLANGSSIGYYDYYLQDNEFITNIDCSKTNFDRIYMYFYAGQKDVQPRVEKLILGDLMIFEKTDIVKIEQKDVIDPNNFVLPTHTLTFEINNDNGQFNPDNPSGIYSYLEEGQEINVMYGLKINGAFEYINGGVYFLTGWNIPQNGITATFYAGSKLDFMNDTFNGGSSTAKSHNDALADVISAGNVPASWFSINSTLLQKTCYTSLVGSNKLNEIVQMICNAERIKLIIDRNGVVHIDEMFDGQLSSLTQESYTIGQKVSFKAGEYEISRPLKDVTITYATDTLNTDVKETTSTGLGEGVSQTLKNLLVSQQATAQDVNNQIINVLTNSKKIGGSFRPDIRLDIWDKIYITNKYAVDLSVLITELEIVYNGAFSGTYKGIIES